MRPERRCPRVPRIMGSDIMTLRYVAIWLLLVLCATANAAGLAPVHVLTIDGQIDPAVAGYIKDGIRAADEDAAQAVLIVMDTPGGLITSTQVIIKAFFASRVPVIVYVSPSGATAASAGSLITMAADIAAMAPVSNIGSASPINMSPSGQPEEMGKTMKKKVENFAAEYAKSIAERRGRNVKWAEKAVRQSANLTANDALKQNVIDYVAESVPELMRKLDGRQVKLAAGGTVVLRTAKAPLDEQPMGAWDMFLHYLSNPMVAMFLFLAAMYGIIYELSNPGAILPGVIGGISLILLLYSFSVIPVNAAGFALIVLAIVFFIAELFTPGTGLLAAGGVVSLFFGLMMLFRSSEGFMVSVGLIVVVTLLTAGFFLFLVGMGIRALKNPYIAGREGVVGHIGEARTDLDLTGKIFINGALWTATSESGAIQKGEQVEVTQMEGLRLKVRKQGS